jgi:hypothetical protein
MASGIAAFPSAYNVYVPDTEATGNLRIEYSRNPKKFALNQYCQIVPVATLNGYYTEMTAEEAGRINAADYVWPDGHQRPLGIGATESHKMSDYRAIRNAYTVTLGNQTVDQSAWDIAAQYLRLEAQKAMNARTSAVLTELTTTGNYASSHYGTAASLGGSSGTWAASTVATQNIRRGIMYALSQIEKDTLSSVDVTQMQLIVSPELAAVMAESGEIVDYLKSSPYAGPVLTGEWAGPRSRGLPEYLYGVKLVVENATYTTSRRGATAARSYILGNATAVLCSRVGGLEAAEGPTFSSVSLFVYREEDMNVEKIVEQTNKRTIISVVDTFDAVMTAPASAFMFTTCQ